MCPFRKLQFYALNRIRYHRENLAFLDILISKYHSSLTAFTTPLSTPTTPTNLSPTHNSSAYEGSAAKTMTFLPRLKIWLIILSYVGTDPPSSTWPLPSNNLWHVPGTKALPPYSKSASQAAASHYTN